MIKIKLKDKNDFLIYKVSCSNYSALEGIALLDKAIDILSNDFKLSDNEIWDLLKEYRNNLKKEGE